MDSPESLILTLNLTIILLAYLFIYPRTAGRNIRKLIYSDLMASIVALIVAGNLYGGSDETFRLLFLDLNWFGFTLITFLLLETPFSLWYWKRYNIGDSL